MYHASKVYQRILFQKGLCLDSAWDSIETIDLHTGGEPLRVVISGIPEIKASSVLDYRERFSQSYDAIRKFLMLEPRGHADMYGCILTPPNDDSADFGVIFLHNEGYSTMCGHAVIALTTLAAYQGWVDVHEGMNTLVIDVPCGRVVADFLMQEGVVKSVGFHAVPSFVSATDQKINISGLGEVTYDIAYGGAFYTYIDMSKHNFPFDLTPNSYADIIRFGMDIKRHVSLKSADLIHHPFERDLSFLYGTIFVGPSFTSGVHSRNVCVFADGQLDRSPTGSGVSGRAAIHKYKGELTVGDSFSVESITGSVFKIFLQKNAIYGGISAVVPRVEGSAHITGKHTFTLDPKDPFKEGLFLR